MIAFLTSSPVTEDGAYLNPVNGFTDTLACALEEVSGGQLPNALFITSSPDDAEFTEHFAQCIFENFAASDIPLGNTTILDRRNQSAAAALIAEADLIILAGGHVPTQNRFFHEIGLRELMQDYNGVVIGISAGSMNAADVVYSQPELEGEAVDPDYERFLVGLGITKTQILPHYQMTKDYMLDGMRLFEDITYGDSFGNAFLVLTDGSYLLCAEGQEEVHGESYVIFNGQMEPLCNEGEICRITSNTSETQ